MCQGLPYWASGGPEFITPCNGYRLQRTQSDPLYSCRFTYTDCYGLRKVVDLNPTDNPTVYVCSSTAPVFSGPGNPSIVNPTGTSTLIGACGGSGSEPTFPCGSQASFEGQNNWPFTAILNIGVGQGTVNVTFTTGEIPDKVMIERLNGQVVYDPGWYGSTSFQAELNQGLNDLGLPNAPIVAPSGTTGSFTKNFSDTQLRIRVYSAYWIGNAGSSWWLTVSCV